MRAVGIGFGRSFVGRQGISSAPHPPKRFSSLYQNLRSGFVASYDRGKHRGGFVGPRGNEMPYGFRRLRGFGYADNVGYILLFRHYLFFLMQ